MCARESCETVHGFAQRAASNAAKIIPSATSRLARRRHEGLRFISFGMRRDENKRDENKFVSRGQEYDRTDSISNQKTPQSNNAALRNRGIAKQIHIGAVKNPENKVQRTVKVQRRIKFNSFSAIEIQGDVP